MKQLCTHIEARKKGKGENGKSKGEKRDLKKSANAKFPLATVTAHQQPIVPCMSLSITYAALQSWADASTFRV